MTSNNVVNLEEIVQNWAWLEYDNTANGKQKKLRQKDKKEPRKYLCVSVDWSDAKFIDETLWSPLAMDQADEHDAEKTTGNHVSAAGAVQRRDLPQSGDVSGSVLFQTRFANNTVSEQEYTMKTEKRTKTTLTTEIEHGFTRGYEMSIKLAAPGDGETFEEELCWGVESKIQVKGGHVADASLVVDERKQKGDFTVVTRVSGPVYVTFTAPRDNNSLVKSTVNDIAKIVDDFLKTERRKGNQLPFVSVEENGAIRTVKIETKGRCRFRYGVKQEIRVNQIPLNSN